MLAGHAQHVRPRHRLDGVLVLVDEVAGIAVVVVPQHAVQRFGQSVEVEDEAVGNGLLGALQFLLGHLTGADLFNFLLDHFDCVGGGGGLCAAGDLKQSGMIVIRSPECRNLVSVTELACALF